MKNSILHVLAITFAIGMVSCDEGMVMDYIPNDGGHLSSEQIEKIAYGCDNYLDEEELEEKLETRASENYLEMISQRLDSMNAVILSPRYLKSTEGRWYGVIKEETCGGYDEIKIVYDCEDSSPKSSISVYEAGDNPKSGAHGAQNNNVKIGWTIEKGDITMRFCKIPASEFKHINQHYAVANFTSYFTTDEKTKYGHYVLLHSIDVYMDAEDNNPQTKIYNIDNHYNGKNGETVREELQTGTSITGKTYKDKNGNLNLSLAYFSGEEEVDNYSLPELKFNYWVFGTLNYKMTADVYSDDEDRKNANDAWLYTYKADGEEVGKKINIHNYANSKTGYQGIFTMNGNTTFHMSRITTTK